MLCQSCTHHAAEPADGTEQEVEVTELVGRNECKALSITATHVMCLPPGATCPAAQSHAPMRRAASIHPRNEQHREENRTLARIRRAKSNSACPYRERHLSAGDIRGPGGAVPHGASTPCFDDVTRFV